MIFYYRVFIGASLAMLYSRFSSFNGFLGDF